MKGKLFVCALVIWTRFNKYVVLAGLVYADCQSDGGWPVTAAGGEAVRACEGDTVGYQVRKCNSASSWGEVETQYCLPKYPEQGKGFVDVLLYISNSVPSVIAKDQGKGIAQGFLSYYNLLSEEDIGIYRIAAADQYTSVQIRITTSETYADSIYKELGSDKSSTDEHILLSLEKYLQHNNSKLKYLTSTGVNKCDIFVQEGPFKREPKAKNNMVTVIVWIVVIIAIIVAIIAGFFIWLQIKRSGSKNGSKQLKNTSKV